MFTHSLQNIHPRKILIFRALMLGDLLCSVPAMRALRQAFPTSHISLLGLPWARSFAERYNAFVDEFIEFPGYPGLPERTCEIQRYPAFISYMQRCRFDLGIQMHGSGSFVNSLMMLFGAKVNAGFWEDYCPSPEWFMPFPQDAHEIHIFARLFNFLGIPWAGDELEFPLNSHDAEDALSIEEIRNLRGTSYVCIHPGARLLTRRWMTENFAKVGDALADRGFGIVLTGGQDEVNLVGEVSAQMRTPHINLAGRTTLGALGWLVKNAQLMVSNDTGLSHVAAALKTPSVIIVSGSDPKRWAPLNSQLHRVCVHDVSCRPCDFTQCPYDLKCSRAIYPEDVVAQAEELLRLHTDRISI